MHAIDDQYYRQIARYYSNQLTERLKDSQLTPEDLDTPPF